VPTVALTLARFEPTNAAEWLAAAVPVLNGDEHRRLAATPDVTARAQHAVGRALLRLVGACAGAGPAGSVAITVSDAGKPALSELPDTGVSVAHSGRAVVVAACRGAEVGVDIEPIPTDAASVRRLAERRFSEAEIATLRELSDDTAAEWFTRAWTIKEAVGKALGVGMIPALAGAVVGSHAEALVSVWSGPPAASWTLHQLPAPGGEEWIAVAIPVPRVELGTVSQLTLEAFAEAAASRGA
jgi:4'-phosphopantetheinyl transferase